MNTNTPPNHRSKPLKTATAVAIALAVLLGGAGLYYQHKVDNKKQVEAQALAQRMDGYGRAVTWCARAQNKLKAKKVDEAVMLYDRCAAEPGNYGKQIVSRLYLYNNIGLPKSVEKAEAIMETMDSPLQASEFYNHGKRYNLGNSGVLQDPEKAVEYWERAGALGELRALRSLATHYEGLGDTQKTERYRKKFTTGFNAANKSETAKVSMSLLWDDDLRRARELLPAAVPEERARGVKILEAIVSQTKGKNAVLDTFKTSEPAKSLLAHYYLSGKDAPADTARAIELFDSIKIPRDFTLVALADTYRLGLRGEVDMDKAIALYEQAERGGIPFTSLTLGHIHRLGMGVPVDARKALSYYEKSRRKNLTGAASAHHLGYLYESGALGKPDYGKAIEAYEHGIARGNVTASVMMARLYERGLGVEKDEAKAFAMMSEAALGASNLAREGLADYYTRGIGTAPDPNTARIWRDKIRPPKDPLAFICDICDPETD